MNISATKREIGIIIAGERAKCCARLKLQVQVHEESPFAGHLAMHMNILRKWRISKSYVAWGWVLLLALWGPGLGGSCESGREKLIPGTGIIERMMLLTSCR